LTRNDGDAKEVVQEAFLRALNYGDTFSGEDLRPWFLKIVRNTSFTFIKRQRSPQNFLSYDEEEHLVSIPDNNPETHLLRNEDITRVKVALETLAVEYREVLILRELENLSYKEIAEIVGVPVGTVMSRLSRGRTQLAEVLKNKSGSGDSR
jgi:RNA polymerase sigma-70 factor (ECF subfamily)